MFRIFIKKKIGSGKEAGGKRFIPRTSLRRNRRLVQRYNVDQKHLTLLNEQDILVIRELSANGFSSDVSDRGFQRFVIDDVYEGKLAYSGQTYPLRMRVSWKKNHVVGFEIIKLGEKAAQFIEEVLEPLTIGSSMKEVESTTEVSGHKVTLEGTRGAHLSIWFADSQTIASWRMHWDQSYVEYDSHVGIKTGTLRPVEGLSQGGATITDPYVDDLEVNKIAKKFAYDVVMGMTVPYRDVLLDSFGS